MVCRRLATPYILLCYNSAMKYVGKKQIGFTIVELLVVIVVIGILATITIVSYSSIMGNAKKQATTSDAMTVASALNKYKADKGVYPPDIDTLKSAGYLNAGTQSTFQYRYTAATNSFCVTASVSGASSFVQSGTTAAKEGGCPGHGVNGQSPITNLVTNPNASSLTGFGSAGATGANAIVTSGGFGDSGSFVRRTFSAAGGGGSYYGTAAANMGSLMAGTTYTVSAYLRSSRAVSSRVSIEWKNDSGIISSSSGSYVTLSGSWQRLSAQGVAPAGVTRATVTFYVSGSPWVANDTQDVDSIMMTEGGTVYNYSSGDSTNWLWNGTPNASTSTGPAL